MSLWSRARNVFRRRVLYSDIDEELRSHQEEARAAGRDADEARLAFGSPLRFREAALDFMVNTWLDSVRADVIFGSRQLRKHKTAAAAAILSLGLGIGSCTSAFRVIDALLVRPLAVSNPDHLYVMGLGFVDESGHDRIGYSYNYPGFRRLRAALADSAELMAIDAPSRINLTFGGDAQIERVSRQYVSGWMFRTLGLRPATGRLLSEQDDVTPAAHPVAVISYDYWTRRFGRDPSVVGRKFRSGQMFTVVGVAPEGFIGTDAARSTDVFVPTMMNAEAIGTAQWRWFAVWVQLKVGANREQVRDRLRAAVIALRTEEAKRMPPNLPKSVIDTYLAAPLVLDSAASGVSDRQEAYKRPLTILGVLVILVLLIACANVANLMSAQGMGRAREMALRVSIGAGQARLLQLVLLECLQLSLFASIAGFAFSAWAAPFVVSMLNAPDDPVQLRMPNDWRVMAFGIAIALAATMLCGLLPALRASNVDPTNALRGGTPRARFAVMHGLAAIQVAFCFLVHFNAGLFVSTFERMTNQPIGFDPEGVLTLETVTQTEQPVQAWYEVKRHIEALPQVQSAGISGWALMSGASMNLPVSVAGRAIESEESAWFLGVSPGWLNTMKIPILSGRDFRSDDVFPRVAAVNQAFARVYFTNRNPVGRTFEAISPNSTVSPVVPTRVATQIVALVADARYTGMREAIQPTVYMPMQTLNEKGQLQSESWATLNVRVRTQDPTGLSPLLRAEVARANPQFRVANIGTQDELVRMHTIRERMLATLSVFFALVSLALAAIGLYGILEYTVQQRRREVGIRIALGARTVDIVWKTSVGLLGVLAAGSVAGLSMGLASELYVRTLLFDVNTTDPKMLGAPAATILIAALLAAIPPVLRAIRTDPAIVLRAE